MRKIILLDYGYEKIEALCDFIVSQGCEVDIVSHDIKAASLAADKTVSAVILAGGPYTVYSDDIEVVDTALFDLNIPLLGLGRGMQVMIHCLGGTVTPAGYQYKPTPSKLKLHNIESGIFADFSQGMVKPLGFDAKVSKLPKGFQILANGHEVESGDNRPFGAIEYPEKKLYGIQYVLDVKGSETDKQAIRHFLLL